MVSDLGMLEVIQWNHFYLSSVGENVDSKNHVLESHSVMGFSEGYYVEFLKLLLIFWCLKEELIQYAQNLNLYSPISNSVLPFQFLVATDPVSMNFVKYITWG